LPAAVDLSSTTHERQVSLFSNGMSPQCERLVADDVGSSMTCGTIPSFTGTRLNGNVRTEKVEEFITPGLVQLRRGDLQSAPGEVGFHPGPEHPSPAGPTDFHDGRASWWRRPSRRDATSGRRELCPALCRRCVARRTHVHMFSLDGTWDFTYDDEWNGNEEHETAPITATSP